MALPAMAFTEDQKSRVTPVVRAVQAAKDSVVNISATSILKGFDEDIFNFFRAPMPIQREAVSLGSGFVIHPSGYIVTNAHVVQQASEKITVSLADKTTLQARKISSDVEHDLAVIKVDPPQLLKALSLGRGDDLMIGETVIAIGNPLGYQHTVTTGVISAVDRELDFGRGKVYRRLIQTDASINPGNSGGPLFNINGELIGINSAIRGDAQNIGFAINVESLKQLLPNLFDVERLHRINLGFSVSPMSDGRHLRVASVSEGSPADKSGIQAGDIIVGYEKKELTDPVDFYVTLLEKAAGQPLMLKVERDNRGELITLPFDAKPEPDAKALAQSRLGLILAEVPNRPLVVVKGVTPESPADQLGIRQGDLIDQLDRYSIRGLDPVGRILEQVGSGQRLYIRILRVSQWETFSLAGYIEVK
jgi:serine protease Do